jgi:hypothetical protein
VRRLVPQRHKLIRHINLPRNHKHTTRLERSLTVPPDVAEARDEARESRGVDGAHAEDGVEGQVVVEDCVGEERGGFDGVGEVAAEFPGHYAGDGLGAEVNFVVLIFVFVLVLVLVLGGVGVEGVELLAYGEKVGVCTPGSDCVA